MSLLNEASFLVTPNGYKEDKLYAAIPTNGDGDMTFTRAGTATRVNEAGLVELVPYNLLSRSEEFDNISWQKLGAVSATANQITSPDGNLTADLITSTTMPGFGANVIYSSIACTLTSYVFSVYLRAGSTTNVTLYVNRTAGAERVSSNLTLTDTWQRYSILWTGTATDSLFFHIAPGGVGIETGSIYAWGAQLNEGSSALTYRKTVDRLDIPRIDYTDGGCPSILLEPLRTNLVKRSQEFDNTSFQKNVSSVSANTTTAPDGTLTADTWTGNGTSSTHYLAQVVAQSTSGVAYTQSVFAKKGTNDFIQIVGTISIYDANSYANFDLENGVVGTIGSSATATITDFGNGWYRCTMTATATATAIGNGFLLWLINSATSTRVETNSLATSVHLWGAQLEAGSYPTSYIPTVASTVTRNADEISKTGISDLLNPSEGTFYAEISALANDLTARILSLSDGTGDNTVQIRFSNASNQIRLDIYGQSGSYRSTVTVLDITENHKVLIKWGPSGIFGFIDGDKYTLTLASGTGSGIPTALDRIKFSAFYGGVLFYGKCKGVQIYKTALSDPQCQALTTL
jgi:hypothetical protein